MIRVLLYEDNQELREAMSFLLSTTTDLKLVGSYGNCQDIENNLNRHEPDVILMDIEMPGMDGLQATQFVKSNKNAIQIIMLTVFEEEDKLFTALRLGANGYFIKGEPPENILEGIRIVHGGGSTISPKLARKVFDFFKGRSSLTPDYGLSKREREILSQLVDGASYKEIANNSFISLDTVRTHIRHIYEKMQVQSKSQAVGKALKDRLF